MKRIRRSLAIMLAMIMVVGTQSVTVLADEEENTAVAVENTIESEENDKNVEVVDVQAVGRESIGADAEQENIEQVDAESEMIETYAAEDEVASGICGDNLTWVLTESGTLIISGMGAMKNYTFDLGAPWKEDEGIQGIKKVVIEEGVTSIGNNAFASCSVLQEVVIPNSVTSIGDNAFEFCETLQKINIPDGVTNIGEWAFYRCDALQEVTIPGGVTNIGLAVFFGSGLQKVNIEEGVTSIGDSSFRECGALQEINIPSSVTSIGDSTFLYCGNLQKISIPNSVTSIGVSTFSSSGLVEVNIPESMTYISDSLFSNCTNLTSITIPSSVTNIGESAFIRCSALSMVYFEGDAPEFSVTSVDNGEIWREPFYQVTANMYYQADNITWTSENMLNYGGNLTWIGQNREDDLVVVLEVTDKVYLIGSGGNATIKCTGELKDFVSVAVDGVPIDSSNYTVVEGSTVLTFLSSYLDTLSVGDHVVTLNYTYGSIDTTLTVLDRSTNTSDSNTMENDNETNTTGNANASSNSTQGGAMQSGTPKTGDHTLIMLWGLVMMTAGCGCLALIWTRKQKRA